MNTRARMALDYTSADGFKLEKLSEVFIEKIYDVKDEDILQVADITHKVNLHGKEYQMEFKAVPMLAIIEIPEPVRAKDTL